MPTRISWLDWKLAARMLVKHPALTIIGGLSLAAAIAIGSIGVELAGELLYKPLPFADGDRIVRLETQDAAAVRGEQRLLHEFAIWRKSLKTVVELGAARLGERNVRTAEGRIEPLRVAEITASAFPLTRVPALLGRGLQPADEAADAAPVVVLAHDVWDRQFLRDPAILGRVVTVGRTPRTVVGVMPPRFGFPHNEQLWVPLLVQDAPPREGPAVQVFGRLAAGATWQDAQAELEVASSRLAADLPATHARLRTRVRAFAGRTPTDPLDIVEVLPHVILLLVLAGVCANVAALFFVRTATRQAELVVRHALGASRGRLIGQIVVESLVLALASALLGLGAAQILVRHAWARAVQIMGDVLPFWVDVTLEPTTVAYALALALVAAGLIGLLPALKATGASVRHGLQGTTIAGSSMTFGGLWSFLIAGQVAFTLLCLPAAAGIAGNMLRDQAKSSAQPADRYLTFRLGIDNEPLPGEPALPDDTRIAARRGRAYERLADRLREEPGVLHVAAADALPGMSAPLLPVEIEQAGAAPVRLRGTLDEGGFAVTTVDAGYLDAFDAAIVAGRGLRAADATAESQPVVVNETFMRVLGRNPVGARIRTLQWRNPNDVSPWREIVGVVTDAETLGGEGAAIYRAAAAADLDPLRVAVRVSGGTTALAHRVADLALQVDPGLQVRDVRPLDAIVAERQTPMLVGVLVYGGVLLVALVFSAASLYALMDVAVRRRTREIGIRIALGANPGRVLRALFTRAAGQVGGGLVAGNAIILFIAWRTDSLTTDLMVALTLMSAVMAAVGILACAAPARRALRVQPTDALRQE